MGGTAGRSAAFARPSSSVSPTLRKGQGGRFPTPSGEPPGTRSTTPGRSRTAARLDLAGLNWGAEWKTNQASCRPGPPPPTDPGVGGTDPAAQPRRNPGPTWRPHAMAKRTDPDVRP